MWFSVLDHRRSTRNSITRNSTCCVGCNLLNRMWFSTKKWIVYCKLKTLDNYCALLKRQSMKHCLKITNQPFARLFSLIIFIAYDRCYSFLMTAKCVYHTLRYITYVTWKYKYLSNKSWIIIYIYIYIYFLYSLYNIICFYPR